MAAVPEPAPQPVARLRGIFKRFPGVQALQDVSVDVLPGEVLGLAGENGSGKSSLVKVLAGRYQPDGGAVELGGRPVRLSTPAEALASGVALIAQEVSVHPHLTVAENLMFGQMPRSRLGVVSWDRARSEARTWLDRLGLDVAPDRRLGELALHQQHMVAIAKMVRRRPQVLVLDEPTSSLTEEQVQTLFGLVRELRDEGTAIVYVTHRLREYFELCDRVVVLRDGRLVAEHPTAGVDEDTLVRSMVGRQLSSIFERPAQSRPAPERPVLRVRGLRTATKLKGIDLEVGAGEIVGVAGQAGAGRSTLARSLFGAQPCTGEVELDGQALRLRTPQDAIRAGIGYVPEDRKGAGLVLSCSVHENLTMPSWGRTSRRGLRVPRREAALAREAVEQLRIKTPSTGTLAGALSGGNQQKVVIAKWMACRPKLLILDEPTRGVDVGAKDEIYRLVEALAASGLGVLVCSSELLELLRLCDRIVVLADGAVAGEQRGAEATEESITAIAFAGMADQQEAA